MIALRFGAETITHAQLDRRAGTTAGWLRAQGVARGDRVAFLGQNHPSMLVLLAACARIGAMLLPLNWRLAPAEWAWILADAAPRLMLATPDFLPSLPGAIDATTIPAAEAVADAGRPDDPYLLVYTSGTTGRPKGAVLDQLAIARNTQAAVAAFAMTPADRVLTVLPLFHVGGLNIQTTPALTIGAAVLLHPRFDADAFLDAVERDRPTLSLLVPAAMQALIRHPRWPGADLSSLRAIGCGSADVPLHLIEAFHAKGVPAQQVYGLTETAPIAIVQTRAEALAAPGSIGRPAAHVEARLSETGEILLRGETTLRRYWPDRPALDAAGWFATGDVGRVDADGRWWFVDRLKHVIISGGENIYPAEVERVLADAPGVAECAVVGRPDPRWGEVPVVVAVPAPDYDRARLLAHCAGRIARFKQPRDVLLVDALPRTALGKVETAALRAMVGASLPSRSAPSPPDG